MFFTQFDKKDLGSIPAVGVSPPPPKNYDCQLEVSYDSENQCYTYEFKKPQYVIWNPDDTLTFHLNNLSNGKARMYLLKYTATEPESVILVDPTNSDQEMTATDVFSHQDVTSVRMKLQLTRHKLLHIGLIVVIAPNDGGETEYLLCDPQVGSGPP
jgi:hypothetical protein